jgi:hypothetical protein
MEQRDETMRREILIYLIFGIGWAVRAAEVQTNVNFRMFLTNPAPIGDLIFQRSDYPEMPPPQPTGDGSTFIFFKDSVYSAIWQENAFCIEPIIPSDFAVTNGNMVVKKRDLDWTYGSTAKGIWFAKADQFMSFPGAIHKENVGVAIHDNALDYQKKILEIVHMGIRDLAPGSFKWSGDDWEGTTLSGVKMTGHGSFDNSGRVTKVEYRIEGDRVTFRVEYYYDVTSEAGDTVPLLPHHFRRIQRTADPVHYPDLVEADFKILKMGLSAISVEQLVLEREHRERGRIDGLGVAPFFEATTQGTFFLSKDGARSPVAPIAHVQPPGGASSELKPRVAFYLLLIFGAGGLLWILLISRRHRNQPL